MRAFYQATSGNEVILVTPEAARDPVWKDLVAKDVYELFECNAPSGLVPSEQHAWDEAQAFIQAVTLMGAQAPASFMVCNLNTEKAICFLNGARYTYALLAF